MDINSEKLSEASPEKITRLIGYCQNIIMLCLGNIEIVNKYPLVDKQAHDEIKSQREEIKFFSELMAKFKNELNRRSPNIGRELN